MRNSAHVVRAMWATSKSNCMEGPPQRGDLRTFNLHEPLSSVTDLQCSLQLCSSGRTAVSCLNHKSLPLLQAADVMPDGVGLAGRCMQSTRTVAPSMGSAGGGCASRAGDMQTQGLQSGLLASLRSSPRGTPGGDAALLAFGGPCAWGLPVDAHRIQCVTGDQCKVTCDVHGPAACMQITVPRAGVHLIITSAWLAAILWSRVSLSLPITATTLGWEALMAGHSEVCSSAATLCTSARCAVLFRVSACSRLEFWDAERVALL